MANIFEFLSKDGNITPEKARLQIDLQIATNGVSRQNRVVWSLCYWYKIFQCLNKMFELRDMTGLSKSLFFVDLVFLTANLTLGDLFPPCHRGRNVDSNVFIELSTVAIDTNTVVINYRREEGGTTWVNPGDFLRTIFGLLGRFLVTRTTLEPLCGRLVTIT